MEINNIVDRLEALIATSVRVPATQKTFMDSRKVQELMDQLRLAVPQDVQAAEDILVSKEEILYQAEVERRKIKAEAEQEFRSRLEQTEVMKEAQKKSSEMIQEAEHKAHKVLSQADLEARSKRAEIDTYAAKTLRNLERQLNSNLTSIRNGLALMSGLETMEVVATGTHSISNNN